MDTQAIEDLNQKSSQRIAETLYLGKRIITELRESI